MSPLENQHNGEIRAGAIRYVTLRADVLMGFLKACEDRKNPLAQQLLLDCVCDIGGKSVEGYDAASGGNEDQLLKSLCKNAIDLGWGKWSFSAVATCGTTQEFSVRVESSPFAEGYGESATPVCAPICGILLATGKQITKNRCGATVGVNATETQCVSNGHAHCEFSLTFPT